MENFDTIYNLYEELYSFFFSNVIDCFYFKFGMRMSGDSNCNSRYIYQCIIELRGSARIADRSNRASISSSNSPTIALKKKGHFIIK